VVLARLRASLVPSVLAASLVACTVVTTAPTPSTTSWDGATGGGDDGAGGGSSSGGMFGVDANACMPGDVQTYRPDAYHPASGSGQGACTDVAAAGFYDGCLGPNATSATCDAFRRDHAACVSCLLTPESAARYGALVDHGTFVTANVAGCVELEDPAALSCAKSVQALDGCELASCKANCAVHDAASLNDFEACTDQADQGGCQAYVAATNTCVQSEEEAGSTASQGATECVTRAQKDFKSFYDLAAMLFCGPPPPDAGGGAPPPADAGYE
jgi:hypothetical protein